MKIKTNANFVVTISDGYCSYSYPLNVSKKMSIAKIANRIRKVYNMNPVDGVYEPNWVYNRQDFTDNRFV